MKNKLSVIFVLGLILFVVLGCSLGGLTGGSDEKSSKDSTSSSSDKDKSETKKPAEPSGEVVKVGIPECDEVATFINDNSEEIEGSYSAKLLVMVYKNLILNNIKEGIENMTEEDKQKLGKACKQSMEQLKKSIEK